MEIIKIMNIERLQAPVFTKPSGNGAAHITHPTSIWSKITKVAVYSSLVVLANHRSIAAATTSSHLNHHNIFSSPDRAHTTSPTNVASKVEGHSHQKNHATNQCKNKKAETCSLDDFNSENKGLSGVGELAFGTIRGAHVYAQSELNCRYGLDEPATIGQMFALPLAEVMRDPSLQQAIKNMTNEVLSSTLPQALDSFLNVTNESELKQKVEDLSEMVAKGLLKGAVGSLGNVTAELLNNPQFQDSIKSLVNKMLDEGLKKMPQAMGYVAAMAVTVIYIAAVSLVAAVHVYQKVMGGKNSIMTQVANDITQGSIGGAANANTAAHLHNLAQNASAGAIAGIVDELKKPENTQVLLNIFAQLVAAGAGTPLNTGNQSQSVNENDNVSGNEYDYDNISSIV